MTPRILLVDDEVAILDGLRRQLREHFTVLTATGGAAGLELLESETVAVVVSDMRMPGMDGVTFLSQVRARYPDSVRILLTGRADTKSAITAVNEGQIHRFLTRPCRPDLLLADLTSAVELNRLITAEKDLLRKTLRGTVETLTATLSLAQPTVFARAVRITRTVCELAEALGVEECWEVEVTAMLAHLGAISLPPGVLEKLEAGRPLTEDERAMADRVPAASAELVSRIPRLEGVASAIALHPARYDGGADLPLAARLLRVATDFDAGMSRQPSAQAAIDRLAGDPGAYDPDVLEALARCHAVSARRVPPRQVALEEVEPGMAVAQDVVSATGVLLVGGGTVVTDPLIERLKNFARRDGISGPILVQGRP